MQENLPRIFRDGIRYYCTMKIPEAIEHIIFLLQKIPGVGRRTAERYAFDIVLSWTGKDQENLSFALTNARQALSLCCECGALIEQKICPFCANVSRRKDIITVVGSPKDIFALERTNEYQGLYHVCPTLSPLDGRSEKLIPIDALVARIHRLQVTEVIIALDSTLEGDTTALYIREHLAAAPIKISRLAFGIPVGSSINYVDNSTLARAFAGRLPF